MTETYKNREHGLNLMISYGLVHFALSQNYKLFSVAQHIVYCYYRKNELLPRNIRIAIEKAADIEGFTHDDDHGAFDTHGQFNADENIKEVLQILSDNPKLKEQAIKFYQLHQAEDFFNMQFCVPEAYFERYNEAQIIKERFEGNFGPDAMVSAKPDMLMDFRDDPKQNLDLLRAYLGIVSMIGRRKFISTNKPAILSRMVGCKSKKAFQEVSRQDELQSTIDKYSKRWNIDRLLLTLAEKKYIMFLSKKATSVIYISRYMEPQELAELVRRSRNKLELKRKIHDAAASLQYDKQAARGTARGTARSAASLYDAL